MTASTSIIAGAPTAGFFAKGDSVTDANGIVWNCVSGGWAAPSNYRGSQVAAFVPEVAHDFVSTAASAAISNTITETLFDKKYSIPAGRLQAGSVIKVRAQGIATATNSTDTLAIKLYLGCADATPPTGGVTLATLAARDVANNDIFVIEALAVVRTAGATGTVVALTEAPTSANAAGTATNQGFLASATLDTTAANLVAVSATWSVASVGNSVRLDILDVDIIG